MGDTENSVDLSLGQVVSGLAGSDAEVRGQPDLQQLLGIAHLNVDDITVGMRRRRSIGCDEAGGRGPALAAATLSGPNRVVAAVA